VSWWDDLLGDLSGWLGKAQDAVVGWTDEVGKGLAWVGQGIASIARAIWDALSYFALLLWDALVNAFQAVRNGLTDIGNGIWWALQQLGYYLTVAFNSLKGGLDWIGHKLYDFGQWVWAGISWIGSQLYNFGSWLWSGMVWVAEQISKGLEYLWKVITGFFGTLYGMLKGWIGGLVTGFNQWTSSILTGFRDKIDDILFANMMILGTRKIIENLTMGAGDAHSFGDVLWHIGGNVGSAFMLPIVGWICKEVLANTVKTMGGSSVKMIPEESVTLKYMPDHAYTPPDITMYPKESTPGAGTPPSTPGAVGTPFTPPTAPAPTEPPYYPPLPGAPGAPAVGYGLPLDKIVKVKAPFDKTIASTDKSPLVGLTKDTTTDSTDASPTITIDFQTEVA